MSSFQWNEMIHVKVVGASRTNIDIHLGDVRGRLVIRCFSAGLATEIVKSMQDHAHALLRRGRGSDESASVSPSWFKLSFGELPLAPVPLSLERVLTQDSSTRVDGLVSIVLREARIRNFVYAEVVSDIEKICSRVVRTTVDRVAQEKSAKETEIIGAKPVRNGGQMHTGEFVKVLKYLNVLPEKVTERRVAEALDPESAVGIDYKTFCARFRERLLS